MKEICQHKQINVWNMTFFIYWENLKILQQTVKKQELFCNLIYYFITLMQYEWQWESSLNLWKHS